MPGLTLGLGLGLHPNRGGLVPPPGQVFLTETVDGVTYYLTETIDGVTYYLTEEA